MILYPEVQERVHQELDRVAGDRNQITMADKVNLPYVEATLNEIWRYCNVAPFGPPRDGASSIFLACFSERLRLYSNWPG
jgi:hypothetical protein